MPDSVLIPAPVKTTARRLLCKISLSRWIGKPSVSVLKTVIRRFGFATAKTQLTLSKRRVRIQEPCLRLLYALSYPAIRPKAFSSAELYRRCRMAVDMAANQPNISKKPPVGAEPSTPSPSPSRVWARVMKQCLLAWPKTLAG
jgi:hypothetical protein